MSFGIFITVGASVAALVVARKLRAQGLDGIQSAEVASPAVLVDQVHVAD